MQDIFISRRESQIGHAILGLLPKTSILVFQKMQNPIPVLKPVLAV
jgi:hypothetical protein